MREVCHSSFDGLPLTLILSPGGERRRLRYPLTLIVCRLGTTGGFSSDSIPPGGERRDLMEIGDEVTILP